MSRRPRVLAIASDGGHWVQLQRLRPAWDDCTVCYVTTAKGYEDIVRADAAARGQETPKIFNVPDANRWQKGRLIMQMLRVMLITVYFRPNVVISTGAAPGLFGLIFGRLLRAKTIWIDSIANAEELSLSGQKAQKFADLWLTQWEELAQPEGPLFRGSVI